MFKVHTDYSGEAIRIEYANMRIDEIVYTDKGYIFVENEGAKWHRTLRVYGPEYQYHIQVSTLDLERALEYFVKRESNAH